MQSVLKTYSSPDATKKSKSELIKGIMVQIREGSPDGGFVKFDSESGQWFEVGDRIAREKVSQTFRDALNDRYKSSTTSKTLKRRQERINRQTSGGSKDKESSSASYAAFSKSAIERHEIPAAQARVDALLMAANATAGKMLPHPSLTNLPPLTAGVSSFMRPSGFLPAPQALGAYSLTNMSPSLTSLMAENAAAAAQPSSNYGQLFLSRELGTPGQLKRSLIGSLYPPPPPSGLEP